MQRHPILFFSFLILFFGILLTSSCTLFNRKKKADSDYTFYLGSYTEGQSEGIYRYTLQINGEIKKSGLAAKAKDPSFLAWSADKKVLLAVDESGDSAGMGTIASYQIKENKLKPLSSKPSGGLAPCFVAVNKEGWVLTANYIGGNVGLLKLDKKGRLSDLLDIEQHEGAGTTERQEAPHAHSAWFEPDASGIIAADLGTNELWFSKIDAVKQKLLPRSPQKMAMAPGDGPRHLAFHPNNKWIYVLNELNNTITFIEKGTSGKYLKGSSISTLPNDFEAFSKSAHIAISSDGRFVYASNRGHNSIVIFGIDSDSGQLKILGFESTHGNEPRHFALSPDDEFLIVANQNTNNVVSFKRDKATGLLTFVAEAEAPAPVCVLFE